MKTAFLVVGCVMLTSGALQLSLVSARDWSSAFSHLDNYAKQVSLTMRNILRNLAHIKSPFVNLPSALLSSLVETPAASNLIMKQKKMKRQ